MADYFYKDGKKYYKKRENSHSYNQQIIALSILTQ